MSRSTRQPGLWRRLGFTKWLAVLSLSAPTITGLLMISAAPWLGPWLRDHPAGPALFIAAFIVLGGLCVLPTYTQCAIAGFAFGVPLGVLFAAIGFVGASLVGFRLARAAGSDSVADIIDEHPRIRAVRDALLGQRRLAMAGAGPRCRIRAFWRTTLLVALIRLMPQSPFAFTNILMASLGVARGPFILGTFLGLLPRSALFVVIGSTLSELTSDKINHAVPLWVKLTGLGITFALVAAVSVTARHAVLRAGESANADSQDHSAAA